MYGIKAVAVNTIRYALRMKVAVVFIILLVVLLPAMGLTMTGDGTPKGRLQSFVSYGMSLVSLLLCLLTIVVSVHSITSDLDKRLIYTVITKPIRRWQLLVGKLLGVVILDAALLALFSGLIYIIAILMPWYYDLSPADRRQLQDEFFTARSALKVPEVDVVDDVKNIYEQRKRTGQIPDEVLADPSAVEGYKRLLTERVKSWKRAVVPGQDVVWRFSGVRPVDPNGTLYIRYKYDVSINPPDLQVTGKWFAGDVRGYADGQDAALYTFQRRDLIRTFHEIKVPADAVASDGFLGIGFFNDPRDNNTIVIFPPEEGLEVLFKAGSFGSNFVRAVLLVFWRLLFLVCMGILAATFLSFPVAVLLCLLVFATGTVSGFCLESFEFLGHGAGSVYYFTVRPLILLLPQLDRYNPSSYLVSARLLSWGLVGRVAVMMVCVKAGLLLAVGVWIFGRREIARVIV